MFLIQLPYFRSKQIKLYYKVEGNGEPLFLIPGLAANHRSWANQFLALKKYFKLITLDNRGIGNSYAPISGLKIEDMISDVNNILKLLKINEVHLLGNSMGAIIANEYANKYPHRVLSLILSSLPFYINQEKNETPAEKLSYLLVKKDVHQFYKQFIPYMFSSGFKNSIQYRIIEGLISKNTQYADPDAILSQIKVIKKWKKKILKKNTLRPDLVIYGSEDMFISNNIKLLGYLYPMAKVEIIKDAGHAVQIERSEEFNKIVYNFLKKRENSIKEIHNSIEISD